MSYPNQLCQIHIYLYIFNRIQLYPFWYCKSKIYLFGQYWILDLIFLSLSRSLLQLNSSTHKSVACQWQFLMKLFFTKNGVWNVQKKVDLNSKAKTVSYFSKHNYNASLIGFLLQTLILIKSLLWWTVWWTKFFHQTN